MGLDYPFLHKIVPVVVQEFGSVYPELTKFERLPLYFPIFFLLALFALFSSATHEFSTITAFVLQEEEVFQLTLARGLKLFGELSARALAAGGRVPADHGTSERRRPVGEFDGPAQPDLRLPRPAYRRARPGASGSRSR